MEYDGLIWRKTSSLATKIYCCDGFLRCKTLSDISYPMAGNSVRGLYKHEVKDLGEIFSHIQSNV